MFPSGGRRAPRGRGWGRGRGRGRGRGARAAAAAASDVGGLVIAGSLPALRAGAAAAGTRWAERGSGTLGGGGSGGVRRHRRDPSTGTGPVRQLSFAISILHQR